MTLKLKIHWDEDGRKKLTWIGTNLDSKTIKYVVFPWKNHTILCLNQPFFATSFINISCDGRL
jgi:hypothetical protein